MKNEKIRNYSCHLRTLSGTRLREECFLNETTNAICMLKALQFIEWSVCFKKQIYTMTVVNGSNCDILKVRLKKKRKRNIYLYIKVYVSK